MTRRSGLNSMRFCECKHGQSAHRNGIGPCFGERMRGGVWFSCECLAFVAEQDLDYTVHTREDPTDDAAVDDAGQP